MKTSKELEAAHPAKMLQVIPIGDYDDALVAQIASQLLQGTNYSSAVTRALDLLDECTYVLSRRAQPSAKEHCKTPAPLKAATSPLSWNEVLKSVTGDPHIERAELKLLDAIKLRVQDGRAASVRNKAIELPKNPTPAEWRAYLSAVPITTTEEAQGYLAPIKDIELVPVRDVESLSGVFARYYPLYKSLCNAESGR